MLPGRYEELVGSLTGLARALAEDESVQDTLQSILALTLRLIPGCHAASVTGSRTRSPPPTARPRNWIGASTCCMTGRAWTPPGISRSTAGA